MTANSIYQRNLSIVRALTREDFDRIFPGTKAELDMLFSLKEKHKEYGDVNKFLLELTPNQYQYLILHINTFPC